MKTMTLEQVMNAVDTIKNGTMTRIEYLSDVKIKKDWANKGFAILKRVQTTGRIGVNYNNIAEVKAMKEARAGEDEPKVARANNYVWTVKNKIKYNTNTDKYYLQFATVKNNANTKVEYIVIDDKGETYTTNTLENLPAEMFCKTSSGARPIVQTIKVSNIIRIGK